MGSMNVFICGLLLLVKFHVAHSVGPPSNAASLGEKKLDDYTVTATKTVVDGITCDPGNKLINDFGWEDYSVLVAMLLISCGIGVFYGFIAKKQTTSDDFLLGGSSMGTAPMAMSLSTSFITAIELLGNPAEMYNFGTQFWLICAAFVLVVPITSKLYLPVYMKLRLTSCFTYLELRFSRTVRTIASGLYIFQMVLYTSVAVYAPALALSNVTGLNTYIAVSLVYVVCIFYASQGGMKAVIITDTFQAAVLIGSLLLIVAFGESIIGDRGIIWSHSYNTERLELFNMNPNPTIRHSFWSVVVGGTFYWTTMFCSNQASIQKYLSVKTISQVRSALWFSCFGLIFVYTVNFYTGMIMTAHYKDCDPLTSEVISASDQLLPLYVINVMGHMRGLAGFFVAGVFAASLGTVAAALTSISAAFCQDFITGAFNVKLPESKGAMVAKWISLIFGVISFALVFVVEHLGSVLQVALSFNGMVGGITLGLFSLGMFFPWANNKGAITGATIAFGIVLWIGMGAQVAIAGGHISQESKETSILGCPCYNETTHENLRNYEESDDEVLSIYKISYLWYSAIGCVLTIIIGLIVSILTKPRDPSTVPTELISPAFTSLYNSFPLKLKEYLNLPKIKDDDIKNSAAKSTSSTNQSDKESNKATNEGNENVFYGVWIGNGNGGKVNEALDMESEANEDKTQKST